LSRAGGSDNATVVGWIETYYSRRHGEWNARFRYRAAPGQPITSINHRHEERAVAVKNAGQTQIAETQHFHNQRMPAIQRGRETTFSDFVNGEWMRRRFPQLSPNSQENYPSVINKWMSDYLGDYPLAELNTTVGNNWIEWMEENGAKPPTIRRALNIARGILTFALKRGVLVGPGHPFAYVDVPTDRKPRRDFYSLGMEHVEALVLVMPTSEDKLITLLMGEEGMRMQEVLPLRWMDLLRPDGSARAQITIDKATSGKGTKRELVSLKTASGYRRPELSPRVAQAVLAFYAEQGEPELESLVFAATDNSHDGMRDGANWRKRVFYPALERIGVAQNGPLYGKITPHRLRAACATMLGYAQWPKMKVLLHLGHQSETTTIAWYQRALEDESHDLNGMSVDDQIKRGRKEAPALVKRAEEERKRKEEEAKEAAEAG